MPARDEILDPVLSQSDMFRANILDDGPWGDFGVQSGAFTLDLPLYQARPTLTIGFIDAHRQIDFLAANPDTEFAIKAHADRTPWGPVIEELGQLPNVRGVSGPRSMSELIQFKHVDEVSIGGSFQEFDAAQLPALSFLHITQSLTDHDVAHLTSLEYLSINVVGKTAFDVHLIGALRNLKGLALHNVRTSDLAFLQGLESLQSLSVTGCEDLIDIGRVAQLNQLSHLRIENCKNLSEHREVLSTLDLKECHILGGPKV